MTRSLTPALFLLSLAACEQEDVASLDLSTDEQVALDAAMTALAPMLEDIPLSTDELERQAISNIEEARAYGNCEVQGVLSGVWYDEDLRPAFEGSWFRLGSGELGGSIQGLYGEGSFDGEVFGPDISGTVGGAYDDGLLLGDWEVEVLQEDGAASTWRQGEMVGRYERRNDYGGFFFGLWGQCEEE